MNQESRSCQMLTSYETLYQPPGASVSLIIEWAPHLPDGTGWCEGDGAAFYQPSTQHAVNEVHCYNVWFKLENC